MRIIGQAIADCRLVTVPFLSALVLFLLAGVSCDQETVSAPSAVARLQKMLEAEKTVSYEGMRDLVWFRESGERRSFFFVQHYEGGPSLVESVGRPGGRNRQWVERYGRLYWLADMKLLLENYLVTETGHRTVSDRDGIMLEIASRHAGRPSIEIVIDNETSVLLAADFRSYQGATTFRSEFRTLLIDPDLPPRSESQGRRNRSSDVEKWKANRKKDVPFAVLEPQFLPVGFVKKSCWKSRRRPRLNTMYSDGLSWIQISLASADSGSPEKVVEQSRCGSRTTLKMVLNGVSIRLVGRLDPSVLLKVLGSLAARTES